LSVDVVLRQPLLCFFDRAKIHARYQQRALQDRKKVYRWGYRQTLILAINAHAKSIGLF